MSSGTFTARFRGTGLSVGLVAVGALLGCSTAMANGTLTEYAQAEPLVSFTYKGLDKNGLFTMPKNVDFWKAEQSVDSNGITYFQGKKGGKFYNVSSVAFQAMASRFEYPELDFAKLNGDKTALTERQLGAFKWLDENAKKLGNGSLTWRYNFPLNYNNMLVTSHWPSAFAQAAVIHAYMAAYLVNKDKAYLDKSLAAAYAFEEPADRGGLTSYIQGLPFFEEVPLPNGKSPHVLNGHLYAVAILGRLYEMSNDARVKKLYDDGLKLTRRILLRFDQGYWTRYDLRPRFHSVPMQFAAPPKWPGVIKRIEIAAPDGHKQAVDLTRSSPGKGTGNAVYGSGWVNKKRGHGWGIGGPGAFLQMYLPSETVPDYVNQTDYFIDVTLKSATTAPQLAIFGFREKIREYYPLKVLDTRTKDDETRVRYRLPISDLQWSVLQEYYVRWHTRLVQELAVLAKDPFYTTIAVRWQNYVAHFRDAIKTRKAKIAAATELAIENNQSIEGIEKPFLKPKIAPIRPRVFDVEANDYLDKEVAQAIGNAKLADLSARDTALALTRYLYFRMQLGNNPESETQAMLEHGIGSCLHYSKVFADLARRAGLPARVYNIYEIPKLGGHNTTEVMIDGKWVLMDPSYGIYFTDKDDNLLSLADVVVRGGKGKDLKVWSVAERGKLERGKAPPAVAQEFAALFTHLNEGKLPEFAPADAFSTGKLGLQGPDLRYVSDWTLAIDDKGASAGGVVVGKDDWSSKSPWISMMGLNDNGRLVSLHELGETRLHNQEQRYTLRNLKPGSKYTMRLSIPYTSAKGIRIAAAFKDGSDVAAETQGELGYGYAKAPQYTTVRFTAQKDLHVIRIRAMGGYALLSSVSIGRGNAPVAAASTKPAKTAEAAVVKASGTATDGKKVIKVVQVARAAAKSETRTLAPTGQMNLISNGAEIVAKTPYYDGHGPENALDGDPFNNYVAAREGTLPNSFTFKISRRAIPKRLDIIWNSGVDYGVDFNFYAVTDTGEVKLLEVTGNKPVEVRKNSLPLNTDKAYAQFRFELKKASKQKRMLMLSMQLFGRRLSSDEGLSFKGDAVNVLDRAALIESKGHDLDVPVDGALLKGAKLSSALGAATGLPSWVTIDVGRPVLARMLQLGWSATDNAPTKFQLIGLNENGFGDTLLYKANGAQPNRGTTASYELTSPRPYRFYRLAVYATKNGEAPRFAKIDLKGIQPDQDGIDFAVVENVLPSEIASKARRTHASMVASQSSLPQILLLLLAFTTILLAGLGILGRKAIARDN